MILVVGVAIMLSTSILWAQEEVPILYPQLGKLYNPSRVANDVDKGVTLHYREQFPVFDAFYHYLGYEQILGDSKAVGISSIYRNVGSHDLYQLQGQYRQSWTMNDISELSVGGQLDINRAENIVFKQDGGVFGINMGLGVLYKYDRLEIGVSVSNILNKEYYNNNINVRARDMRYFVADIRYNFDLLNFLSYQPSVLYMNRGQFNLWIFSQELTFFDLLSLGGSYYHKTDFKKYVVMAGLKLINKINIYDLVDVKDTRFGRDFEIALKYDLSSR